MENGKWKMENGKWNFPLGKKRVFNEMASRVIIQIVAGALSVIAVMIPGACLAEEVEPPWKIVDRMVAVLDSVPVLLSDVLMESDLGLLPSLGSEDGFGTLLEPYLNRLMIQKEVEEVGSFRLSPGQYDSAFKGFLAGFSGRDDFEDKLEYWGVDEQEVRRRLARALIVSLYTESRIQFFIRVLPSDVERAYREDPDKWGGRLLYDAWNDIRESLLEEAFTLERERWLKTLRQRYELRIIDPMNGA
jgi:hypothetical protein